MTMTNDRLVGRFEENREHLRTVAYRILGSMVEAEDAVQESWIRLNRADTSDVENLSGWLTTVVSRVCLDMLRSRRSRREDALDIEEHDTLPSSDEAVDPEREALLADSMGSALLVVLETLTPAERLSFVLHDMFAVPFEEIAEIVGRSPAAARQLASRARRRVQGADPTSVAGRERQRGIVAAFLAASREGRFDELLAMLDPNATVIADKMVTAQLGTSEISGAREVATFFSGRAQSAELAIIDGTPGAVWRHDGRVRVAFVFSFDGDRVTAIEFVSDKDRVEAMTFDVLEDWQSR